MGEKTLGRGLKDLLGENLLNVDEIQEGEVIVNVPLKDIKPNPFQPRTIFNQEKIDDLASSIREYGVFQPIILKPANEGYIIVSGERRYRASLQVGLETIPAIIRQYEPSLIMEIALLENLQREDLTPIEEANAYRNIIEKLSYTQKELADRIGKSRSYVTNVLGLLNLDENIQKMILSGDISMGHARVLSKLEDPKRAMELANMIVSKGLSVRQIEEMGKSEKKIKTIRKKVKNPSTRASEKALHHKYGNAVTIKDNKIIFRCEDENMIKELVEKLLGD